jgi:hypothetical protein
VNHRLSEQCIRSTYRELIAKRGDVSGRGLREELRRRFGAVGKTARVFAIWREEVAAPANKEPMIDASAEWAEFKRRLAVAEEAAAANLKRAERAEFREQAHREQCALEIERLTQELKAVRGEAYVTRVLPT